MLAIGQFLITCLITVSINILGVKGYITDDLSEVLSFIGVFGIIASFIFMMACVYRKINKE